MKCVLGYWEVVLKIFVQTNSALNGCIMQNNMADDCLHLLVWLLVCYICMCGLIKPLYFPLQ